MLSQHKKDCRGKEKRVGRFLFAKSRQVSKIFTVHGRE